MAAPVESKVSAAAVGALLANVVLALLGLLYGDGIPQGLEAFIYSAIPALVAFVSGYMAKHTPRAP